VIARVATRPAERIGAATVVLHWTASLKEQRLT
jgi:hypothetical protein